MTRSKLKSRIASSALLLISLLLQCEGLAQYQQNRDGNAIVIGNNNRNIKITIAPNSEKSEVSRPKRPTPPQVAVEQTWKSLLRLGKLDEDSTDKEILRALPAFAIPDGDDEKERLADEYREMIPQLRGLQSFPGVLGWQQFNFAPLDDRGSKRIAFQALLQNSPYAYNRFGQLLPPPFIQLFIDMDKDGVPHGFNMSGFNPYVVQ